jgi:uncharacterized protein
MPSMSSPWDVPELNASGSFIRISPDTNVPMTARVQRLVNTNAFRRLSRISQLGLVSYVYPGATHSRFEHSLGVYRNAIEYINRLATDPFFRETVDDKHVRLLLVASLLHDIGHWPFCHAIEDMRLPGLPRHESLATRLITNGEIADALSQDWQVDPAEVASLLSGTINDSTDSSPIASNANAILLSVLSGPIDIDKIDYLERDSLHAGVPYGRNFDRHRLISSLCMDAEHSKLAITDKGRTAAEMMVFARYVMFSEVYWHHAVRSGTAMLQRGLFELVNQNADQGAWIDMVESQLMDSLHQASVDQPWFACIDGLFGPQRLLYKRLAQFDVNSQPELHQALSRRPYAEIVELSKKLVHQVRDRYHVPLEEHDLLIDAPPMKLEVQFQMDVKQADGRFVPLGALSPVVHALATRQFDDIVKKVRIFVHPKYRDACRYIDFAKMVSNLI